MTARRKTGPRRLARNPRDLWGGGLLVGVALIGLVLIDARIRSLLPGIDRLAAPVQAPLSSAHGAYLGAGSVPFGLFVLIAACGVLLVARGLTVDGPPVASWPIRSTVLILLGIATFGLTIEPLGLAVAGPLAIGLGALAERPVHWREMILSALGVTAASIVLFRYALKLPVPVAPWLGL